MFKRIRCLNQQHSVNGLCDTTYVIDDSCLGRSDFNIPINSDLQCFGAAACTAAIIVFYIARNITVIPRLIQYLDSYMEAGINISGLIRQIRGDLDAYLPDLRFSSKYAFILDQHYRFNKPKSK